MILGAENEGLSLFPKHFPQFTLFFSLTGISYSEHKGRTYDTHAPNSNFDFLRAVSEC